VGADPDPTDRADQVPADTSKGDASAYPQRVIVVIGSPIGRLHDDVLAASGTASRVALAAARLGRKIQLVGKTGDDPTADAVVLDLARGGVGHVALLRDPGRETQLESSEDDSVEGEDDARPAAPAGTPDPNASPRPALEAADVELGLRYLTDFAVVVLAEPADPETVAVVADAARWSDARMILVVEAGSGAPDGLPSDASVFEAPERDPDGVFAELIGGFAAALDEGTEPGVAFRTSIASDGWTEPGGA
jgi:hypothetical protein